MFALKLNMVILLLNSPLRTKKIPTLPRDLLPPAAPGGAQRLYSP